MKKRYIPIKHITLSILYFLMYSSSQLQAGSDLGIVTITSPVSDCGLTDEETVVVIITNYGDEPSSDFTVAYQVTGMPIVTAVFIGTIDPEFYEIFAFDIPLELSLPGEYILCVWTELPGDEDFSNDTLCVIINSLPTPVVDLGTGGIICGPDTLNAENPDAEYIWNTGDTTPTIIATESGTYSVLVTNIESGCTIEDEITLEIEPLAVANFTYLTTDLIITFTNMSIAGITYLWDFGDGTTSDEENPVHTYAVAGIYPVTLKAINECSISTITFTIDLSTSINQISEADIVIYPNPISDYLFINFTPNNFFINSEVIITDATGKIIFMQNIISNNTKISTASLSKGVYFMSIKREKRFIYIDGFVKQ